MPVFVDWVIVSVPKEKYKNPLIQKSTLDNKYPGGSYVEEGKNTENQKDVATKNKL